MCEAAPDKDSERHPGAADVALVVEVADSSPSRDRATAGIPTYLLIDLAAADYAAKVIPRDSDSVTLTLDGQASSAIAVAELLPTSPQLSALMLHGT